MIPVLQGNYVLKEPPEFAPFEFFRLKTGLIKFTHRANKMARINNPTVSTSTNLVFKYKPKTLSERY